MSNCQKYFKNKLGVSCAELSSTLFDCPLPSGYADTAYYTQLLLKEATENVVSDKNMLFDKLVKAGIIVLDFKY